MAKANDVEAPLAHHDEDLDELKEHPEKVPNRCQERQKPIFVLIAVILLCGGLSIGLLVLNSNKMTDKTLLLIIGGEIGGEPTNDVTSHIPSNSIATCNKTSNFPLAVSGPVGVVLDQTVLVCGGLAKRSDGARIATDECYRLEKPGWVRTNNTLSVGRAFAAGVYLTGFGFWISGGISSNGEILASSELVRGRDDNTKIEAPSLPSGLSHHCVVKLSQRKTLIIGGKTKETKFSPSVWMFDWKEMSWSMKPNLNFGRHGHVCTFDQSRNIVIVAGGITEQNDNNKVEILDLSSDQWKVVSPLTKPVLGGSFVKINDLPTIVGGSAQSDKTMLQLTGNEAFSESQTIFKPEVQNQRQYPVVLDVHESYVCFEE